MPIETAAEKPARRKASRRRADAPASWELAQGDEIAPGLVAIKELGGGTRYEVYLAISERHLCPVVAKILRPDRIESTVARRDLRREARILARVNHPVIVRSFGAEFGDDRPRLLLEHIEGPQLRSMLKKYGTLALEQIVPLFLNVAASLHYLHGEQFVHLDIKPANIVMSSPPRLIDFSVALPFEKARAGLGTPGYMAPEQCSKDLQDRIGPGTDVWGLGVTMYEAALGERPFPRPVKGEAPPQLETDPAPLPDDRLPHEFVELVTACLERHPSDRPTAGEVVMALEPLVDAVSHLPKLGRRPRPAYFRRS